MGIDSTLGFMFCGAFSGVVARTVAAPFERLKILYQTQDLSATAASDIHANRYSSIGQSLSRIYRNEGIMGYFRGNGANLVRAIPYQSVQFVTYDKLKIIMSGWREDGVLTVPMRLSCGALSGCASVLASYPFDLVRCRLSAQESTARHYNGIWDCLRKIYMQEGVFGIYRGIVPTMLGIAPYVALNFSSFEFLKACAVDWMDGAELNPVAKLSLSAMSGTFSQTVTYPLDVIRRRMQMEGFGGKPVENHSIAQCVRSIYVKYGWRGFYKGLHLNIAKVVPVVSIGFVTYDYTKKALGLAGGSKEL